MLRPCSDANILTVYTKQQNLDMADKAWKAVEEDEDIIIDRILYNCYAAVNLACGKFDKALALLKEMKSKGVEPDAVTYNTLISGIGKNQKNTHKAAKMTDELLADMKESGIEMDVFTYVALIRTALKMKRLDQAVKLLEELLKQNFTMSSTKVSHLIDDSRKTKLGTKGKSVVNMCWRTLDSVIGQGQFTRRDKVEVFESFLQLLVSVGQWRSVFGLLDHLHDADLKPSTRMINAILTGIADGREVGSEAVVMSEIMIGRMTELGLHMDFYTYAAILRLYLRVANLRSARFYLDKMKSARIKPHRRVYNDLISFYAYSRYVVDWKNSFVEAQSLLEEMKAIGLSPDQYTYSSIVKICAMCFEWQTLDELMAEVKQKGLTLSVLAYSIILNTCAKDQSDKAVKSAWKYFNEMKQLRLPLNVVVYTTMINVCLIDKDIKSAMDLLDEMKKANVDPNEATYTSLMNVAGHAGDVDLLKHLFDEMPGQGLRQNSVAFCVLLLGYGRSNKPDKILEVHEEIKKRELHKSQPIFDSLVHAAALRGRADMMQTVFEDFKQLKAPLDHNSYIALAQNLEKVGDAKGAEAIREMDKELHEIKPRMASAV